MFSRRLTRLITIGAVAIAIGGGAYGIVNGAAASPPGSRGGASNARSGPAAGGTMGTVDSASASSFTLTTPAGQKVTVKKAVSSASVRKGENVLVLGTVDGTTITARALIAEPTNGSAKSAAAGVVPFQHGSPSTAKQVGSIPASYDQGSGTIVNGTTANKATEAALAAYPGGIVDRVVKLGNGEFEVHNIGVDWPHHIFVSRSFKVVGAD
jgi:hypothetical protein